MKKPFLILLLAITVISNISAQITPFLRNTLVKVDSVFTTVLDPQNEQGVPYDAPEMFWGVEEDENEFEDKHPYYDRFGNHIPAEFLYTKPTISALKSAGYFEVSYDEIPKEKILSQDKKAVIEQVLVDISNLLAPPPIDVCTGQPGKVRIRINSGDILTGDAIGAASAAFNTDYGDNMVLDGEVWKVLVTGNASEKNINHGFIKLNPDFDFYTGTGAVGDRIDLYTVILHEVLHAMGFHSLIDFNGKSTYAQIGQTFFSRFDLLLQVNGNPAINKGNPVEFYGLTSNLNEQGVKQGCAKTQVSPSLSACSYLNSAHGIYAPQNAYEKGSSLSHLDASCTTGKKYTMDYSLGKGEQRRVLDEVELQLLAEIGYKISVHGQVLGGVDDGLDCANKPIYKIKACQGNTLSIPITNNDGLTPDDVVGVRVLGNSNATASWNGAELIFTPELTDFGYVVVQYVPKYGCQYGAISELLIYVEPCKDEICHSESLLECEENCNSNFLGDYIGNNDCTLIGKLLPDEIKIPNWSNLGGISENGRVASPNYHKLRNNSYGIGMLADEAILHDYKFSVGNSYLIRLKIFTEKNCAFVKGLDDLKRIRIQALGSGYFPYSGRPIFSGIENHITSSVNTSEIIKDVTLEDFDGDEVTICYTPTINSENIAIYTEYVYLRGPYLVIENFLIKKIPSQFSISDKLIDCVNETIEITQDDNCNFSELLNFTWEDAAGSLVEEGLSATIASPGNYSFNGVLKESGEKCFSEPFKVVADGGYEISAQVTQPLCNAGGSIDLTVTGNNPNAVYTYQWSGASTAITQDLNNIGEGIYTVTISTGECVFNRTFELKAPVSIPLKIIGDKCFNEDNLLHTLKSKDDIPVTWFKDGVAIQGAENVTEINVTEPGVYRIEKDFCHVSAEFEVKSSPELSVRDLKITACVAEVVSLSAVGSPNDGSGQYIWVSDDFKFFTTPSINVSKTLPGVYEYSVSYIFNSCVTAEKVELTILPLVSNNTISAVSCPGDVANIKINGSKPEGGNGQYTYQWQAGIKFFGSYLWSDIPNAVSEDYEVGLFTSVVCYRRIVTSVCDDVNFSNVICNAETVSQESWPITAASDIGSYGFDTEIDAAGNTYVIGAYTNYIEIEQNNLNSNADANFGANAIFVAKFSSCGTVDWIYNVPKAINLEQTSIPRLEISGDYLLSSFNYRDGSGALFGEVLKLDLNGNLLSSLSVDSHVSSISVSPNGNRISLLKYDDENKLNQVEIMDVNLTSLHSTTGQSIQGQKLSSSIASDNEYVFCVTVNGLIKISLSDYSQEYISGSFIIGGTSGATKVFENTLATGSQNKVSFINVNTSEVIGTKFLSGNISDIAFVNDYIIVSVVNGLSSNVYSYQVLNDEIVNASTQAFQHLAIYGLGYLNPNTYNLGDVDFSFTGVLAHNVSFPNGTAIKKGSAQIDFVLNKLSYADFANALMVPNDQLIKNAISKKTFSSCLYPNPASGIVQIDGEEINSAKIYSFYDNVELIEYQPVNNTIDVSDLKAGIYVVHISQNDGTIKQCRLLKD